jgi:DNA repair exonuclease SbcCD ATPase subunit
MLKSINISNFQSHKDTHLEFSPGVNIIVGSSDSGKTAILRALKWLTQNRPSGDEFRSHWGGETKVTTFTDDAHIVRLKDKENKYILGDSHFTAFGTDVPQEIKQVLNLNEINLQQQLDQPFLLTDTPGEVAHHFNKVAHLEKIDVGLKRVQSWIRELEQTIRYKNEDLTKTQEEVKKYEYLEKMEMDVEAIEMMEQSKIGKYNIINRLSKVIEDIKKVNTEIEEYSLFLQDEDIINNTLSLFSTINKIGTQMDNLTAYINTIQETEQYIEDYSEMLKDHQLVNDTLLLTKEQKEKWKVVNSLTTLESIINQTEVNLTRRSNILKQMEEQFHREMPDICPLCGK